MVVLHNIFGVGAGGQISLPPKSKSKLHGIIASISPNEGANKSTLTKKSLHTSFKPVLKCKEVDNLKIFLKDQNSQRKKKKKNFWILKIRCSILLYSKNFFAVFKI